MRVGLNPRLPCITKPYWLVSWSVSNASVSNALASTSHSRSAIEALGQSMSLPLLEEQFGNCAHLI